MVDMLVLSRPAKSLENGAGFSEQAEPMENERVALMPQSEQMARMPELLSSKRKKYRTIRSDHQAVRLESQGEREAHLGEKEKGQSKYMERKESAPQ